MLKFLQDDYTLQAGDLILGGWAGRGYNIRAGAWETTSGGDLTESKDTPHHLRAFHVWAWNAAGVPYWGMAIKLYVVAVGARPAMTIRLPGRAFQAGITPARFVGDFPLGAGVIYRVQGAFNRMAIGDRLTSTVYYEER
jgi:hypothetical protein